MKHVILSICRKGSDHYEREGELYQCPKGEFLYCARKDGSSDSLIREELVKKTGKCTKILIIEGDNILSALNPSVYFWISVFHFITAITDAWKYASFLRRRLSLCRPHLIT